MRALSLGELDQMAQVAEDSMPDLLVRMIYTEGTRSDDTGLLPITYEAGDVIHGGLRPPTAREAEQAQTRLMDAVLRVPLHVELDHRDRLKHTHHYGQALAEPITYEVIGTPIIGPSANVMNLAKVTDSTDGG